jgi:pentatricopeptide repeat protein
VQLLLSAYQKEGLYEKAVDLVKKWMKFNQDDENSRKILRQFEEKLGFNVQN